MINHIDNGDRRCYSGDHRLTRGQQEKLTQRAWGIVENDQQPWVAPTISIRDFQKVIGIALGIRILPRGKEWLITEVRTSGAGNSRWFGGCLRFTSSEQQLLTGVAKIILQHSRKVEGQLPLPYLE